MLAYAQVNEEGYYHKEVHGTRVYTTSMPNTIQVTLMRPFQLSSEEFAQLSTACTYEDMNALLIQKGFPPLRMETFQRATRMCAELALHGIEKPLLACLANLLGIDAVLDEHEGFFYPCI